MSAKARVGIAAVVIAVLGAALFFFLPKNDPHEAPAASTPVAVSENVPTPSDEAIQSEEKVAEELISAEASPQSPVAKRAKAGPGRIYGEVTLPDGSPKTPITLEIHRVDTEATLVSYNDTKVASTTAAADNTFSFDKLPLGRYQVYASTATLVAQTPTVLQRVEPEVKLTLRLAPGGTISGRVVDSNREPIAGANVFVGASNVAGQKRNTPRERALSSRVVTDADGRFTMGFLRLSVNNEPGYRLAVKAEGFATLLSDYIQAGTSNAELVLTPGAILSGSLIKAGTTEPVPEQTVYLETDLAIERLTATSDAEGFFFIPGVPAGIHMARLLNSEFVIVPESGLFTVPANAESAEVALQVLAGAAISGRVYDIDSNSGIADITISAWADPNYKPQTVTTAADGSYRFSGLAPTAYQIGINKPSGYTFPKTGGFSFASLTPESGSELKNINFTLTRGLSISGVVVDDEGKPIPQASISGSAHDGNDDSEAKTDDSGAFTLSGFNAGTRVDLYAYKEGFAQPTRDPRERRRGYDLKQNLTGIKMVLIPGATVSGTVVDTRGAPVRGAMLMMQTTTEPPRRIAADATSDATGAITFKAVPPGEFLVGMPQTRGNSLADEDRALRITVPRGGAVTGLRFVVPATEGQYTISGRVVDARGKPITRASVSTAAVDRPNVRREVHATSDANGAFVLSGLEEGAHTVWAQANGFVSGEQSRVMAGAADVVITVKDFARIEGRVINEHTGQPIPLFTLNPHNNSKPVRDPEGRFVIDEATEDMLVLQVEADGYAPAMISLPSVVLGQTLRDVIVRMSPGAELRGIVRDRAGQPIAGAWIGINAPKYSGTLIRSSNVSSGLDGTFQMRSLPAGAFELSVSHQNFAFVTQPLNIAYGANNYAEVTLTGGASLTGVVTLHGKPVDAAYVYATVPERGGHQARTNAQGRYRIEHLNAGQAQVQASHSDTSGHHARTVTVNITQGVAAEANIDLGDGGASIEGTIFSAPGTPDRSRAGIGAHWDNNASSASTQADANGNYVLDGLPAGEVIVTVYIENGRTRKQVIVPLVAGQRAHKDIVLSDGTNLRVDIAGVSSVKTIYTNIMLVRDHVAFETVDDDVIQKASRRCIETSQVAEGYHEYSLLEPGAYTVLIWEYDYAAAQLGKNPYNRWTAATIDVTSEPEQNVQVSL